MPSGRMASRSPSGRMNWQPLKPVWPVPGWDDREGGQHGAALTIEAPAATEDPALASDYSQALLKDAATPVDTAAYKKDGPYTIAVSQQDPSNGWGNTYNVTIDAYGKELLEQGVLAKPCSSPPPMTPTSRSAMSKTSSSSSRMQS